MTFVCNFSRIGRKLKEIGWSGKDFSKFLFPTREEEKEEEEKTRVKVRFYRGSYGCMRVEPFDQFTLIHTVLRRVSFLKGARRNIQNGGIIFNVKKGLKKRKKNPSKQSIFRLKYNFPRYDVNASSYFAQSRDQDSNSLGQRLDKSRSSFLPFQVNFLNGDATPLRRYFFPFYHSRDTIKKDAYREFYRSFSSKKGGI